MRGIEVRSEQYMEAAEERLRSGKRLAQGEKRDLADAGYHAGLAVECALLAHLRPNQALDHKHRLELLVHRTALRFSDREKEEKFGALLTDMEYLWKNALRYYPTGRFEAFCREAHGRKSRKRQESTVACVRRLLEISEAVVKECKTQWKLLNKKTGS